MNRALLERMNSYQPKPGIAATSPNAFRVAFYVGAVMVLAVVVPSCLALIGGCTPGETKAAEVQAEVAAGGGEYGTRILACYEKVRDGGTFRDFQKCACDVDRAFQLDASSAGAECAP